jgi:predicted ArsR family transcriptional regulator
MELSSITPDPTALKALSHPVRLRILGLLRSDGPATATSLAQRLGLNSGATSYHLRQLAQHGFVEDDAGRGNARDRWWRAAHQSTRTDDRTELTPEGREAVDAWAQSIAVVHTEQLQRAIEERSTIPLPWRLASTLSDWNIRITPERAESLMKAIVEVIEDVEEDPDDPAAGTFSLHLHAFPRPGTLPPVEDAVASGDDAADGEETQ